MPKFKITEPQKLLSSSGIRDLNLHLFTAFQPMSVFGKLGNEHILNFGVTIGWCMTQTYMYDLVY